MRPLNPRDMVLNWLRAAASPAGRRVMLLTFLIDAPFAFVFLIAVQTYLPQDTWSGVSLPGLSLALFGGGKLVAQYVGGRLTDHIGLRNATIAGITLIVVAQAALLLSTVEIAVVLPASAAYGAGSAVVWPAVFARASRFPSDMRAQISAAMTVTSGVGMAAALALGWLLPEDLSFGIAVAGTLALVSVALVLAAFAGEPPDPEDGAATVSTAVAVLGLRDVFATPTLLRLGLVVVLQSASVGAMMSIFRALGRDLLDISLREQMVLFVAPAAGFATGVVLAGLLGSHAGRRSLLAVAFGTACVSFLALTASGSLALSVTLLTTGCLGLGMALPTTTATGLDMARETPGVTFGFLLTLEGLGHALGPAGGAVFGNVEGTLVFIAALLAAAFLTCLTMAPAHRTQRRPAKLPAEVAASTVEA
jgi:predicted MFS family arabinose efflux permease